MNNEMKRCGAIGSGDNDSVIYFFGSLSKGVVVKNNIIGGLSTLYSYGIYEKVDITGHVVVDNSFLSGFLSYPYYDYYNGSLSIEDLNNGWAGTFESSGNIVY